MNSVTRFFDSGFFHESVSPQPQSIPLGSFKFFRKFAEIFASQGAPPAANCQRYQQHRRQICHRYQQHQGRWWQNLPPVTLIPVEHLGLGISPGIFEKNSKWTVLLGYSGAGGGGGLIHEKNQKQKITRDCPFKANNWRIQIRKNRLFKLKTELKRVFSPNSPFKHLK